MILMILVNDFIGYFILDLLFVRYLVKYFLFELVPLFIDGVLVIELLVIVPFGCVDSPYLRDYVVNKVKFVFSPIDKGRYN